MFKIFHEMIWLTKSSLITVSIKNIDLEAATWGVLEKKVFLKISKNFKEIHGVFFFLFSCKFSEIFKNTCLAENLWTAGSFRTTKKVLKIVFKANF